MAIQESKWITVERPGWFGEAKDDMLAGYDKKYGEGRWRIRHRLGPRLIALPEALRIYELCYELHFLNPQTRYLWTEMFKKASEVWTELDTDVESGYDYSIQKAKAPHYEDVSIRIIMKKYGHVFKGSKPIRIRADSTDVIGVGLSSIHVPFIWPECIEPYNEVCWWNRHAGSLEYYWHANKVLQTLRNENI